MYEFTVEREEEDAVYFWGGIYSQWFPSEFVLDGLKFNCAEQYMMYQKALIFGDYETETKILSTKSPSEQKALGRQVKNYDDSLWSQKRELVVYRGNLAKFSQNKALWEILIGPHRYKTIVEASPEDKIWGIGLHFNDDRVLDRSKWKGLNLLGKCIMKVREDILSNNIDPYAI